MERLGDAGARQRDGVIGHHRPMGGAITPRTLKSGGYKRREADPEEIEIERGHRLENVTC